MKKITFFGIVVVLILISITTGLYFALRNNFSNVLNDFNNIVVATDLLTTVALIYKNQEYLRLNTEYEVYQKPLNATSLAFVSSQLQDLCQSLRTEVSRGEGERVKMLC